MRGEELSDPRGVRWIPDALAGVGVLVLAGSSGRVDSPRAQMLARQGAIAESIQWFGGPGQHEGPWTIPLEVFLDRVTGLRAECDRVIVLGTSFGAEAAMLVGAHSRDVDAVAAFAPSDVVWAGVQPDGTVTSHWTLGGEPLPYVPFDDSWQPDGGVPAYVGLYSASRERFSEHLPEATIPAEQVQEVLLVCGGDDRVWPAKQMADSIAARRTAHGLYTSVVYDAEAGHRTVLPGEPAIAGGMRMQRGGSRPADERLGEAAWLHLKHLLQSGPPRPTPLNQT